MENHVLWAWWAGRLCR